MPTSVFLAKLIGPIWLVLGASLAVNRKSYTVMAAEFVQSRSLVYLAGTAALTGGLAIVLNHNVWSADWRVIITLFGWVATLAGVTRLMFPDRARSIGARSFGSDKPILITGVVWLALGALLCFFGYIR